MSEEPLETAEDATTRFPLRWGYPLVRATALARAARAGEVLLDPSLRAIERGELLIGGSRSCLYGKLRIRGVVLNVAHPWQGSSPVSSVGFSRPQFIPRNEMEEVVGASSGLTVVFAAPGAGASRFLEEVALALGPRRVLHVMPETLGEPLGALRLALLRSMDSDHAPAGLTTEHEQSLEGLIAGEDIAPDSGAELVVAWVASETTGRPGVVLVDDASDVDADSLEAIGQAYASTSEPFHVIVRLAPGAPIPKALSGISAARSVELLSLSTSSAEELAALAAGGAMDQKTRAQWAIRGGRIALAVVESVREAVEGDEIAWDEGSTVARSRSQPPSGPRPPGFWIRQRFVRQGEESGRVLASLAILGGHASPDDVSSMLATPGVTVDIKKVASALEASGWLVTDKLGLHALASATHGETVLRTMKDSTFTSLHRAAARAAATRDRPLAAASAAVHYVLAGDVEAARETARRAAAATRAIGLEATASGFDALAEHGDFSALSERNLFGAALRSGRPVHLEAQPPARALEALRTGDAASVERLAKELRVEESRSGLADRLQAMADLARGDTGDAIRRLRDGANEARRSASRDRCRSLLALGVALAAANRNEEALLEVLDALARARETKDDRGERACLRFLSQLAKSAGHDEIGEEWASAAEA
jgi:hypothetical protein